MANRRKFLAGLGALASGSAAAMGTGAFTTTQAGRNIGVGFAGDKNAYLGIEETSQWASHDSDGVISINFGSSGEGGWGMNQDAYVKFEDVFKIKNQGSQTYAVWFDDGQLLLDRETGVGLVDGAGTETDPYEEGQYWSDKYLSNGYPLEAENSLYNKLHDQTSADAGYVENHYDIFTDAGVSSQRFTDPDMAPWRVDTLKFASPSSHGVILEPGDSVHVDFQFGDTDFEVGKISDAKMVIWAYSKDYALEAQSE